MSQLVMIEFQDTDAANAFVQNAILASQLEYERVGMWLMPSASCQCDPGRKRNNNDWSRKNKANIPVCINCKKPSGYWKRGLMTRLNHALGRNKLES